MNSEVVSNSENHRKRSFRTVTPRTHVRGDWWASWISISWWWLALRDGFWQVETPVVELTSEHPASRDFTRVTWIMPRAIELKVFLHCLRSLLSWRPSLLASHVPAPGTGQQASGASSILPCCRSSCKVNNTRVSSCLHSPCLTWDCKLRGINLIRNKTLQQRKIWANLY